MSSDDRRDYEGRDPDFAQHVRVRDGLPEPTPRPLLRRVLDWLRRRSTR